MIFLIDSDLFEDIVAADGARPPGRHEQTAEHPDGRRFAGAVGAEKTEYLTLPHLKADIVDGDKIAEGAPEVAHLHGQSLMSITHPRRRASLSVPSQ